MKSERQGYIEGAITIARAGGHVTVVSGSASNAALDMHTAKILAHDAEYFRETNGLQGICFGSGGEVVFRRTNDISSGMYTSTVTMPGDGW